MIQIIKPGTKKITKCNYCGCQFSYEEEDIQSTDRVTDGQWLDCPQCGKQMMLVTVKIPIDASKSVQRRIGFMTEESF